MISLSILLVLIQLIISTHGYSPSRVWQAITKFTHDSEKLTELYGYITCIDEDIELNDLWNLMNEPFGELARLWYEVNSGYSFDTTEDNYFLLNNKKYTNSDDSFYLKSSELKAQKMIDDYDIILENEYPIGSDPLAPLITLYGCETNDLFYEFNQNLYSEAKQGKIRLIWRATCTEPIMLNHNGIELAVKNSSWGQQTFLNANLPQDFLKTYYCLDYLTKDELEDLDLKVTNFILRYYKKTSDFDMTLKLTQQLINNFPLISRDLLNLPTDFKQVKDDVELLIKNNLDYNMLGLFINGQFWKLNDLNPTSIVASIVQEWNIISFSFDLIKKYYEKIHFKQFKGLINIYSQKHIQSLHDLQPVRYNLHRISGFSESIIYFNDIEKDNQYEELTSNLTVFFEKYKYGDLPSFKENWNEVIFVIDFDNLHTKESKEALGGLNRALNIVLEGYPQRIGLLPLYSGSPPDIVLKIYQLKDESLGKLINFLSTNLSNKINVYSPYTNLPPVKEILSNLHIKQTSIIINGLIFPFKSNTWNYLIAKHIKHDVKFIKSKLSNYNPDSRVRVRDILHSSSMIRRNLKYVPDNFEDGTYTSLDNSFLNKIDHLVAEYNKNGHFILHTITLVDDFTCKSGLQRLINLMEVIFNGIRIRCIHKGSNDKTWMKLKTFIIQGEVNKIRTLLINNRKHSKNIIPTSILNYWLVNLPVHYVKEQSFMILNGRYIHFEPEEIPTTEDWESIIRRESIRGINIAASLDELIPEIFQELLDADFFEQICASLTKSLIHGRHIFNNGIDFTSETFLPKMDIDKILDLDLLTINQYPNTQLQIDITLIIDPLEERTQKLLHLVSLIKDLEIVNVHILFLPTTSLTVLPIHRIYLVDQEVDNIMKESLFDIALDAPQNIVLGHDFYGKIKVDGIIIEVYAQDYNVVVSKDNVQGIGGVCLNLINNEGDVVSTGISMDIFGYTQLKSPDLKMNFRIQSCDDQYQVHSYSFDARADYLPTDKIDITTILPIKIYVKVKKTGKLSVQDYDSNLNVLIVIHNFNDETLFKNKLFTIIHHNTQQITFWILDENSISSMLKEFLVSVCELYPMISIKYISYIWPSWLRPQRFIDRRLDVSKILFLDVALPKNIEKLVFLSLTQFLTPNIHSLTNIKAKTTFTMNIHQKNSQNYWEHGYWKQFLNEHSLHFYDIDSTFLINMEKYRQIHAGDKFRIHYQRLSNNIHSLIDIDQDLINNLQLEIPISSIPQIDYYPDIQTNDYKIWHNMIEQNTNKQQPSESYIPHDEL